MTALQQNLQLQPVFEIATMNFRLCSEPASNCVYPCL